MFRLPKTLRLGRLLKQRAGFTMIELLIVITILGILSVAVLSAINPVEQINRGRDTGARSDAEQLLSAMDRYNAFNGYEPYRQNTSTTRALAITLADENWIVNGIAGCSVFQRLGTADSTSTEIAAGCRDTDELKEAFLTRISNLDDARKLRVYNAATGPTGTESVYVCFAPQSSAFRKEATDRCGANYLGLPTDLQPIGETICNTTTPYICLP